MKRVILIVFIFSLSACSVFGDNGVESAPYTLLSEDSQLGVELRNYDSMILVSASMGDDGQNNAFRKLFRYISGYNQGQKEIAMTAPVFMDDTTSGTEIAMTAPVFMSDKVSEPSMSFVMPKDFTIENTPIPKDPTLSVTELKSYRVAAIGFSGFLSDSNVEHHTDILRDWIKSNGYKEVGPPVKAGYNGPLTLPFLKHNEVLIEIEY